MAILTTVYDVESNIQTTPYNTISPTATTGIVLNVALTITKGVLTFETNGAIEYISFGGATVASGRTTLSDVRRNLTTTLNDFSQISATGLQHIAGVTIVRLVDYHALFNLKAGTSSANTFTASQLISGTNKLYLGDTSSYVYDDGTDIHFKSSVQSDVSLSALATAAGTDEKTKTSLLDTTAGYLNDKIVVGSGLTKTILNPGANETLELDSNASFVGLALPAGEVVDGSGTPQLVYVSDGTGGRTAGAFYKADADDFANMASYMVGFVTVNASVIGTSYNVQTGGIISGFSGLTIDSPYFMSTAVGAITATVPSSAVVKYVGRAISATQLLMESGLKMVYGTYSYTANASAVVATNITVGFRPLLVFAHLDIGTSRGSSGVWMNGGAQFSLENKNIQASASGDAYLGAASVALLYSSTRLRSTETNYITNSLAVTDATPTTLQITRTVVLTGTASVTPTVYLNILGY